MTVRAPLATDLSARNIVISMMSAKNPAAASVSHIGNDGERQIWSNEEAQAQFMLVVLNAAQIAFGVTGAHPYTNLRTD